MMELNWIKMQNKREIVSNDSVDFKFAIKRACVFHYTFKLLSHLS